MITNETVLVLGAGASIPYGYPSGHSLRQMLINPSLFDPALAKQSLDQENVDTFCRSFMLSGMKSIDAFLARRGKDYLNDGQKNIEDIGKYGIALALRQNKSLDTLFHNPELFDRGGGIDRQDNWYEYLWAQLSSGITNSNLAEFSKTRLTVVTFNYDLSLEHYLFTAAKYSYGLADDEATKLLEPIKFIHLYGQLSGNPFSSDFCYEFNFQNDFRLIVKDAALIQVIDEQRELDASNFPKASDALTNAQRICFLGFGFDETNVRRLDLAKIFVNRARADDVSVDPFPFPKVVSTSLGFETAERLAKQQLLTVELSRSSGPGGGFGMYGRRIDDGFAAYTDCKSEVALKRSQILH